jgi:protein-S-isoprenylcysteine O-methyltransferase
MIFNSDTIPPLVTIYFLSEFLVQRYKRKDDYAVSHDQGSLHLLIAVTLISLIFARLIMFVLPQAQMDILLQLSTVGIGVFIAGLALRWYSIIHLGRFFTTEVAIAADHKLIDTGPFRFVRHPSYLGILLQFLAIGIRSGNILALLVLMLPLTIALLYRMRIEETALAEGLGSGYADYMRNTKRIIPFIY